MSATITPTKAEPIVDHHDKLRTRSVDVVSSLLLSLVIMVGVAVVILGAMYLVANIHFSRRIIELPVENVPGRGDHAEGFARDLEAPGSEEVEDITAPTLEQTLEAMTETLTAAMNTLDSMDNMLASKGKGGLGDSRPPGPLGEGNVLPRFERWQLKFTARNANGYATQLDFFGIELGCIGGGVANIDYASKLGGKANKRSAGGKEEKRLYFKNQAGSALIPFDQQLLKKAGIKYDGRIILKFINKDLEDSLAQLEQGYAMDNRGKGKIVDPAEFAKTVFECRPKRSGGFEWVVIDQRYRKAPPLKK